MTQRQSLRAIARATVEDFSSSMNHLEGDAVMGHLVRAARASGATELRVDLLTGAAAESALLVPPVRTAAESLAAWFRELLERGARERAAPAPVRAAELAVTLDPATARINRLEGAEETPFSCTARITDARGAVHSWRIADWW
jgi:hypothetical protein